jgi:predicted metal-dependent HD superfamily phosphohydrolase
VSGDDLELRVAWLQHVGEGATADRWFESLLTRHRAPGRHYHGVRHVVWVVRHVSGFIAADRVDDPGAVVAAAFFHDAVYEVSRSDNEHASARLAHGALGEIGWRADRRAHVATMIEATADHVGVAADRDTAALLAADLAVLAADPARYGDYARAVRREYEALDDDSWRVGRSAVLRRLLASDHLFDPRLELTHWERRARANLTAELATLHAEA